MRSKDFQIEVGPGGANPASVYCTKVGGNSRIFRTTGGETGACEFADGYLIEEWTLLRGFDDESNAKLTALIRK